HRTQSARRANGDARPYWSAQRERFELFLELPRGADGKRRRKRVHGATEQECRDRATRVRATQLAGLEVPNERRTVAQLLDLWLLPLPGAVAPGTVDTYRRTVRLYLTPTLGRLVAQQVRPSHVRQLVAALAERGLSPHSVRLARATLRRAFEWAVSDELLG